MCSCEHGKEPSVLVKGEQILDYLSDYTFLKKDFFYSFIYLVTEKWNIIKEKININIRSYTIWEVPIVMN